MKIHSFNQLCLTERTDFIWQNGLYIDYRFEEDYTITLYRLEDFYVEIFYNTTFNAIDKVNSFEGDENLKFYLNDILTTIL